MLDEEIKLMFDTPRKGKLLSGWTKLTNAEFCFEDEQGYSNVVHVDYLIL